jgi:hypothetical protein
VSDLKSSYELAMERLKQKDAAAGVERRPVTDAQKAEIAEMRSRYEAKLAELDVLHQREVRDIIDPEARAAADDEYRRSRERLTTERDAKVDKVRDAN